MVQRVHRSCAAELQTRRNSSITLAPEHHLYRGQNLLKTREWFVQSMSSCLYNHHDSFGVYDVSDNFLSNLGLADEQSRNLIYQGLQ